MMLNVSSIHPRSLIAKRLSYRVNASLLTLVVRKSERAVHLNPSASSGAAGWEVFMKKMSMQEVKQFLAVEMVKLRSITVKFPTMLSRTFSRSVPGTFTGAISKPLLTEEGRRISFTLSNLAGHGSFLLLALSYCENDLLQLRLFAASGMTLSIIFQYYRAIPLWIPIRWNLLFLAINATMIGLLYKEEVDADNMSRDEKALYTAVFEKRGLKKVDFSHLMSRAQKQTHKSGSKIAVEGEKNNHVHLVFSGQFSVMKNNNFITRLGINQFVGEMSFLRWQSKLNVNKLHNKQKLIDVNTVLVPLIADKATQCDDISQGEACFATVVCIEDSVTYSWSFVELHDLLIKEPAVGLVFEGVMSADMNEKFILTPKQEPLQQYRQVLNGAMLDGEVTDKEKVLLEAFRHQHDIAYEDHLQMIKDLGWSERDFDCGSIGGPSVDVTDNYFIMLDDVLNNNYLSQEGRKALRTFRIKNKIHPEKHLDCLQKLGWTLDDYDAGNKNHQIEIKNEMNNKNQKEIRVNMMKNMKAMNDLQSIKNIKNSKYKEYMETNMRNAENSKKENGENVNRNDLENTDCGSSLSPSVIQTDSSKFDANKKTILSTSRYSENCVRDEEKDLPRKTPLSTSFYASSEGEIKR